MIPKVPMDRPTARFTSHMLTEAAKDLQAPDPRTVSKSTGKHLTRLVREWARAKASAAHWMVSAQADLYFGAHGFDQLDSLRRVNWDTHAKEVLGSPECSSFLTQEQRGSILAAMDALFLP
jgi:hypothetical protein